MQPTLYLFMGPPGAGKTTVANYICGATGAVHIWADRERSKLFLNPTHSKKESRQLYELLNARTATLLGAGKSVVFDTNFNFYKDREHLRSIASKAGAKTVIIQLTTPLELARQRALHGSHAERNGMDKAMTPRTFDRINGHLEPLRSNEQAIRLSGENITIDEVLNALETV
jgi:predicted kinase